MNRCNSLSIAMERTNAFVYCYNNNVITVCFVSVIPTEVCNYYVIQKTVKLIHAYAFKIKWNITKKTLQSIISCYNITEYKNTTLNCTWKVIIFLTVYNFISFSSVKLPKSNLLITFSGSFSHKRLLLLLCTICYM